MLDDDSKEFPPKNVEDNKAKMNRKTDKKSDAYLTSLYLSITDGLKPTKEDMLLEQITGKKKKNELGEMIEYLGGSISPSKERKTTVPPKIKDVPPILKKKIVEAFFQALEKEKYVDDDGIEHAIVDRSSLPWKFYSNTLAAYIAEKLKHKPFEVKKHYRVIEMVGGYSYHSIQSLLYKSPAPEGYEVVNRVVKQFK